MVEHHVADNGYVNAGKPIDESSCAVAFERGQNHFGDGQIVLRWDAAADSTGVETLRRHAIV
jgi:hypothetical protein